MLAVALGKCLVSTHNCDWMSAEASRGFNLLRLSSAGSLLIFNRLLRAAEAAMVGFSYNSNKTKGGERVTKRESAVTALDWEEI